MNLTQAIALGAVQGATEFLPISSTAHLVLFPWFLGWEDPGLSFDVALHLGTLVALLLYFRTEWLELIAGGFRYLFDRSAGPKPRMPLFIVIATIPGAVAGALFEHKVETALRNPMVIAVSLIVMGIAMAIAERMGRRATELAGISQTDAVSIGIAQALAIIPGVSRSGVTITAGLFRGLKREAAARFSFLLSAPLIAGAVGKKLIDILREGMTPDQIGPLVAGIVVSGIVGYASIAFLLRYLSTRSTHVFVVYRVALGVIIMFLTFWKG